MYIVFGNKIVDTEEIKKIILDNTDFEVLKDMSKGTKREDMAAFNLALDTKYLDELISETSDIKELDEDELFEEYVALAEELGVDIEEHLPKYSKMKFKAYKWDLGENKINCIVAIGNMEVKENKMLDIIRRLESQTE
ncbi:MAG: hypothetical protein ACRC28_15405 [Clostridium sp.]|uniref:hypothetical protein n=1 Tax=Clostridium sp. TaxID=1506 RepID=UPI003F3B07B1